MAVGRPPTRKPGARRRKRGPGRPAASTEPDGAERILRTALLLFPHHGFAGTSIDQIVVEAGVTPPTLYHHYGTKSALFVATARHVYRFVLGEFASAITPEMTLREALDAVFDVAVRVVSNELSYSRMILTVILESERDSEMAAQLRPLAQEFRAFFEDLATRTEPTRAGVRHRDLARAIVALINGLNVEAVLLRRPQEFRGMVDAMRELLGPIDGQ